jgi:elongation factor 1-beta
MADNWNVVAKIRIMPDDVSTDVVRIAESVKKMSGKNCLVHSIEVKPIAFGLNAIEANILFNDKLGGMDEIEAQIRKIPGVGEAEVTDLNRL